MLSETPVEQVLETLEDKLSFFINQSINESSVSGTAQLPLKWELN